MSRNKTKTEEKKMGTKKIISCVVAAVFLVFSSNVALVGAETAVVPPDEGGSPVIGVAPDFFNEANQNAVAIMNAIEASEGPQEEIAQEDQDILDLLLSYGYQNNGNTLWYSFELGEDIGRVAIDANTGEVKEVIEADGDLRRRRTSYTYENGEVVKEYYYYYDENGTLEEVDVCYYEGDISEERRFYDQYERIASFERYDEDEYLREIRRFEHPDGVRKCVSVEVFDPPSITPIVDTSAGNPVQNVDDILGYIAEQLMNDDDGIVDEYEETADATQSIYSDGESIRYEHDGGDGYVYLEISDGTLYYEDDSGCLSVDEDGTAVSEGYTTEQADAIVGLAPAGLFGNDSEGGVDDELFDQDINLLIVGETDDGQTIYSNGFICFTIVEINHYEETVTNIGVVKKDDECDLRAPDGSDTLEYFAGLGEDWLITEIVKNDMEINKLNLESCKYLDLMEELLAMNYWDRFWYTGDGDVFPEGSILAAYDYWTAHKVYLNVMITSHEVQISKLTATNEFYEEAIDYIDQMEEDELY